MYFVKKITLDEKQSYLSSNLILHSNSESASSMLESAVKTFAREELGREASDQITILTIKNFSQVNEPLTDGMLAYCLEDNMNSVHIYQRKTNVVKIKGYIYGSSDTLATQFRRTHIFEVEEYDKINIDIDTNDCIVEKPREKMTSYTTRSKSIPKRMDFNIIDHLKKNPMFQARFTSVNNPQNDKTEQLELNTLSSVESDISLSDKINSEQTLEMEPKQVMVNDPLEIKSDTENIISFTLVPSEYQPTCSHSNLSTVACYVNYDDDVID